MSTKKAEYAADDVRYLIEIKSLLIKRLKALDRFSWFEEEQLNELKKSNIIIEPNEAWKKINYPLHFYTQELALLKNIACWREDLAIKYNIPKRWIFSDSSATKLMLKNEKKTTDVVNNIKQQLTDSEMSKLMKILSLKKVIKNKNLSPKKDIEKKCSELKIEEPIDLPSPRLETSKLQKTLEKRAEQHSVRDKERRLKSDIKPYHNGALFGMDPTIPPDEVDESWKVTVIP